MLIAGRRCARPTRRYALKAREAEFVEAAPFIGECGDVECRGLLRLTVDAFDVVASQPGWYLSGEAHGFRAAVLNADGIVVELPHKHA